MGGTWVSVSSGRVLQGADSSHSGGTTIEAGLPDIKGSKVDILELDSPVRTSTTGAFSRTITQSYKMEIPNASSKGAIITDFIASDGECNGSANGLNFKTDADYKVYGKSKTVQPPAFCVYIWKRTA